VAALLFCIVSAALVFGSRAARAQSTPTPTDSGTSDLLSLPTDKPIRGVTYPAVSPDGRRLCFTYLGDVWTVSASGGVANRLTVHEALDSFPHWSPDGKWIAFTSLRTGNYDIFLVPAEGGEARQVTFHSSSDIVTDWSPDGRSLLFYSMRDDRAFTLYSIDLHTRDLKRLSNDDDLPARFGVWSPDGKTIAYTRGGEPWWRPWYRGSVAASTILEDVATRKVRTLYKSNGQQFWPLFSSDGKSVYVAMIGGNSNTPNLWRIPINGGEPHAITHYTTDAVRFPAIAHDGSLLAYVYAGDLYTVRPDGGSPTRVNIIVRSDDKVNNQERVTLTQEATESELSPDGKQLALVVRGDIWLIPVAGGDAKRLTDDPATDNDINWSPDGTKLVMVSDRGNQTDLYTLDVKTKALIRLTNDPAAESNPAWSPDGKWISFAKAGDQPGLYLIPSGGGEARRLAEGNGNNLIGTGITAHAWSPDSKWVAFSRMDRYKNRDIWVVPAIGGAAVNITRYPGDNGDPQFTKDGRRLLFVSDRNGPDMLFQVPLEQEDTGPASGSDDEAKKAAPDRSKDVKIDFEDIHLRAKAVSLPVGDVDDYAPTPDSQKILVHMEGRFWAMPIRGGGMQLLTPTPELGGAMRMAPDGARFYFLGANGTPRTMAITGAISVIPFKAEMLFDRRVQYEQAFNEFYRRFGASFYDAKMNGVDWKALRAKYEPLLQGVGTSIEFANLLAEMVGEVNSSHSEVFPSERASGPQTATLGLFYDSSYTGPGLKVRAILPKGPADKRASRVDPGDYILSVDGTDVRMNENFYETLQDKAGKTVELLVNSKPSKDGARTIKIKPISLGAWFGLEYDARIRRNRELVDRLSDHRLAYIHIQQMDPTSLRNFERELFGDAMDKDGLVLDIRGNPGGNVHDAILDALSRRVYGYTQPRDGLRENLPEHAWTKPIVLLIDQTSDSDAEIFPAGFRALHLGKIVGVPTPGYVIGTYEAHLADGTSFRLPSWAFYTSDGKNLESLGVPPDILVENTPEDIAAGRDRQLETAVETALKELPARVDTTARSSDSVGAVSSAITNPNGGSSAPRSSGKARSN
jgi:Tol biopolymer transport system component/C-terminal processing protease CtpA/Prc